MDTGTHTLECHTAFREVLQSPTSGSSPLSPLSPLLAGGSGPIVVGIHVCLLLCLWREPGGVPLYLGDGGDSGDENHNLLGDFTAADRSPTGKRAFSQTECQD